MATRQAGAQRLLTAAPSRASAHAARRRRSRSASPRSARLRRSGSADRASCGAQRRLPERDPADRAPSRRSGSPAPGSRRTGAGFRSPPGPRPAAPACRVRACSPFDGARPLDFQRFGMGGDRPRRRSSAQRVTSSVEAKPCLRERVAPAGPAIVRQRTGDMRLGLFKTLRWLCHIGRHDASKPQAAEKARGSGEARRPRADRPRLCWPGMTATAASCRGAPESGETARPVPRLAVGDHAAADHREGGRAVLSRSSWRAGRRVSALAAAQARRSAEALGRTRLLRARPQSSRLRSRGRSSVTAARFPHTEAGCAPCPASAPIPPRRSRPSPSTARPRRSTAISSA